MSYCLDNDVPVMGLCRGMQMLAVVSGADIIQDIPTYFEQQGVAYDYQHRNEKSSADAYRDYAPHAIAIGKDFLLYDIIGSTELDGCPSWHHQAVLDVDDTRLAVTGSLDTNGIKMIEAVEQTDKDFAIGLQFHPEAAVAKHLQKADNADDFMDKDTAMLFFERLVDEAQEELESAA